MKVSEAISWATEKLSDAKVSEPKTDAEWLLAHVLNLPRTNLKLDSDRSLTAEEQNAYERLVSERAKRFPLAYILGEQPFLGLVLKVDKRAMIPRPETEQLVEKVIKRLKGLGRKNLMLADIGTGSGAIALSLANQFPDATAFGVDISKEAIDLAEENAQRLGLTKRSVFLHGDLTEPLESIFPPETFDAIIANLPYVSESEWEQLEPEIRLHEPDIAFLGGSDGLSVIKKFVQRPFHRLLSPKSFIALEVGANQAEKVQNLLQQRGWQEVTIEKDLCGIQRFVFAKR
ncbi:MAG: peptide chain release factor N(5)-glutamine methyltransferase [Armatimonadetes bacterium]|nr:peptide chain release factor N(5)-glutamine methyltransferase [Armatimonadota bacterium]MDW8028985.1 peptide chain release factor N(5)-glutamine methyltransferase [Armatimonadota bacterium]